MKYKDIVTLSDKCKYIVVETVEFEDKKYFYLIDIDKDDNIKIGYQDNDEFVEIQDPETIKKLIALFGKKANNILRNNE